MKEKQYKLQSILVVTGIMLISHLSAIGQIDSNFRENQKKAFSANSAEECQTALLFCNEVLKIVPNHPIVNYLAARLNSILGNEDIALQYLKKATELGYTTKLPFNKIHHLNDSAFITLREKEGFSQIIEALERSEKPIHKSQIAFTISDKELVPEGITYDPVEKMFYFGSETKNKIIKVDPSGKSIDFTKENQDGLGSLRGIHIDPIRGNLWVCSESKETTGVFKYDLSSGKLIKKYILSRRDINRSFNDLVIHPNGDVYITDVISGNIHLISYASDELEVFLKSEQIISPNGITLSADGHVMYTGDSPIGIYQIDIKTKSFSLLPHSEQFSSTGIDGLYFHNNSLYAVQTGLNIISRFSLNKDATSLESCEVYERNTPYLDWPTTGVIVDDYFYFIADTQGKGSIKKGVVVMKTILN